MFISIHGSVFRTWKRIATIVTNFCYTTLNPNPAIEVSAIRSFFDSNRRCEKTVFSFTYSTRFARVSAVFIFIFLDTAIFHYCVVTWIQHGCHSITWIYDINFIFGFIVVRDWTWIVRWFNCGFFKWMIVPVFCDLNADKQNKIMQNDWRIKCRVDNIALFTFIFFLVKQKLLKLFSLFWTRRVYSPKRTSFNRTQYYESKYFSWIIRCRHEKNLIIHQHENMRFKTQSFS